MAETILETKLHPPALRDVVSRERLIHLLQEGLTRKLILISAPAGFGKTTLVAEWAENLPVPVAWLSLDDPDNDLVRFFMYFVAALRRVLDPNIGEGLLDSFREPRPRSMESVLSGLINELLELPNHVVLEG